VVIPSVTNGEHSQDAMQYPSPVSNSNWTTCRYANSQITN